MITDKSLPALPPNAIPPGAFSEPPTESDTPTELSPRPRPAYNRNDSSSRSSSRPARSPERTPAESGKDSLSLPQASYRNNRNSSIFMPSDAAGGDAEAFFIPVALDPGPAPTPRSASESQELSKKDNRDYFSPVKSSSESKAESAATTPHIAFQEKGRQSSSEDTKVRPPGRRLSKSSRKDSGTPNSKSAEEPLPPRTSSKAPITTDDFKLQDAPRGKKFAASRTSSQSSSQDPDRLQADDNKVGTPRSSLDSRKRSGEEGRERSDSSNTTARNEYNGASKPVTRKEVPHGTPRSGELIPSPPLFSSPSNSLGPFGYYSLDTCGTFFLAFLSTFSLSSPATPTFVVYPSVFVCRRVYLF